MDTWRGGPEPGRCISVIIPALNEAATIREAIAAVPVSRLRRSGLSVEVLVVDNDSVDETAAIARRCGVALVAEPRRGYGRALRTGFAHAAGDVLVIADADGTYPLHRLEVLLQPILDGDADVVTGSRLRGRIAPGAMPALHRYVGVPFLTLMLRLLFRVPVSDGHCGMRACTRSALDRLHLRSDGMEFATEFLIRAAQAGLRVVEVPVDYDRRQPHSASKLHSLRDGWRHLHLMLSEYLTNRRPLRPLPEPSPYSALGETRLPSE